MLTARSYQSSEIANLIYACVIKSKLNKLKMAHSEHAVFPTLIGWGSKYGILDLIISWSKLSATWGNFWSWTRTIRRSHKQQIPSTNHYTFVDKAAGNGSKNHRILPRKRRTSWKIAILQENFPEATERSEVILDATCPIVAKKVNFPLSTTGHFWYDPRHFGTTKLLLTPTFEQEIMSWFVYLQSTMQKHPNFVVHSENNEFPCQKTKIDRHTCFTEL